MNDFRPHPTKTLETDLKMRDVFNERTCPHWRFETTYNFQSNDSTGPELVIFRYDGYWLFKYEGEPVMLCAIDEQKYYEKLWKDRPR